MPTEPVYVPHLGRKFFPTPSDAACYLWHEGEDPTTILAHPCTVAPVGTPSVHDVIEQVRDTWACEFDDPDEVDMEIGIEAFCALESALAMVAQHAPTAWLPRLGEVVVLPSYRPAPSPAASDQRQCADTECPDWEIPHRAHAASGSEEDA